MEFSGERGGSGQYSQIHPSPDVTKWFTTDIYTSTSNLTISQSRFEYGIIINLIKMYRMENNKLHHKVSLISTLRLLVFKYPNIKLP